MALCILTAYGLQSVMLSDTTWPFLAGLDRSWRGLHIIIKRPLSRLHNNIEVVF